MSLQTQKTYPGKTQAIVISEVQSEEWVSYVRIFLGFLYVVSALMGYLLGTLSLLSLIVGGSAAVGMLITVGVFLFRTKKSRLAPGPHSVYAFVLMDATVITAVLWAYALSGASSVLHHSFFCVYFLVLIFTALHYRAVLAFFGGAVCVLQYSIFYFWLVQSAYVTPGETLGSYFVRVGILLIAAVLGAIISWNNSRTIQKVVSSEVRYQNLVHRLPEMLFTADSQMNFLWANVASYAIFGIPCKVIRGRSFYEFLIDQKALRLRAGGTRGIYEVRDSEGTRKFVEANILPVNEEGNRVAWEGILSDVTDRELAISQREEMVQRLYRYQKMESLSTLASGMAHDFNNILQTITDVVEQIERHSNEEQTHQQTKILGETLVDARFMVSELLAVGRKKPLNFSTINVKQFLNETIQSLSKQLGETVQITLDIIEDQLAIQGNKDYLKRVFHNLFVNARDAMHGEGTIAVEGFLQYVEGGVATVVIRVSDTGPGIDPEIRDKIFDPLFTTKKPGKGTGLGLALVNRIVTLHNGNVFVKRTSSEGTTFQLELPLWQVQTETGAASDSPPPSFIPARLLLIDDDNKIREILRAFLSEYDYQIYEAGSIEEAESEIDFPQDQPLDVLIMDWRIGNDDPRYVVESVRSRYPDVIVIVVSGYPADNRSIKELKISRWFTKPYDKNQLHLEMQTSLYRQKLKK